MNSHLRGHGTILIVDDEEIVRKAATISLQRHGYHVVAAASGPEAIQIFRRKAKEVSLVLLDLTMPGMNGEEVMRELLATDPSALVLLSSGFNEVESIRHFTGKGLAGFIQKPYSAQALAAKVKEVLNGDDHKSGTIVP